MQITTYNVSASERRAVLRSYFCLCGLGASSRRTLVCVLSALRFVLYQELLKL